jgi:hypothetical protein
LKLVQNRKVQKPNGKKWENQQKSEKPKKKQKKKDRTVQTSVKQKTTKHSPIIYAALSSE